MSEENRQDAPEINALDKTANSELETRNSGLALPEGDVPSPPRPLAPGAFLGGEYEVKEVLMRGLVNFYAASGGDYSSPTPFLVAERELPEPILETPSSEPSTPPDALQEAEADIIATLGESAEHPAPENLADEAADGEVLPRAALQAPLFVPGRNFQQDGREYLVCEWQESTSLQDWREPTNDARYLAVVSTLVEGVYELEAKNLSADFSHDTLRFDEDGQLRYFGFVDENSALEPNVSNIAELREINSFLLKHVFAESATMRLDDEWSGLALSEEVKAFATNLLNDEYSSCEEIRAALPAVPVGVLRVGSALAGDVGMEREVNEDSGAIVKLARVGHVQNLDLELYAVADGMGGHEGGEVASDLTINALHHAIAARVEEGLNWSDNVAVRSALWQVIEEVNSAVLALTEEPKYRALRNKPGATLTFALRVGATLFIGNVGDSRAYKWNETGGLQPITKDHSYVQSLIDSGQLAPEDAWGHPDGSIITSHIGMQKLKLRDVFLRLVSPGDKILLVSDGVIDMMRDEEIAPFLSEDDPHVICSNLVDASNAAGGHDNITVVCVCFK